MTKLPQTISKKINILTGREAGDCSIPPDRCKGRTTAMALVLLGEAQASGISFGFDYVGNNAFTKQMADHLRGTLEELVKKANLDGFTFKIMMLEDFRGYKGYHNYVEPERVHKDSDFGVAVFFNPIKEVIYDLRK